MLVLVVVATFSGMLVPMSQKDAQALNDELNQMIEQNGAAGNLAPTIFIHNLLLCLAMFIPLAGLPIGLGIMFMTGMGFRAAFDLQSANAASTAAAANMTPATAILLLISILLTFLCEYTSYVIGMTESVWLFRRITQNRWRELKTTAILIGTVTVLLAIGAIVETWAVTQPL